MNRTARRGTTLAIAAIGSLTLAACGGGGGFETSSSATGGRGGDEGTRV